MLYQHIAETEVGRQALEEFADRFEAAGRGADADDREDGGPPRGGGVF